MDVTYRFAIPDAQRHRLLNGLDAIAETMLHDEQISRHERLVPSWMIPSQTA
jgi:3-isopropylmalate/(R)-2-methylmalate dehydratase small subunit